MTRQIGVLVAIARWWHSGGSALRRPASRPAVATCAILGFVLVIALAPDGGSVHAASLFEALRAPGQAGFVAGHRGDKDGAPENTLPAFELAINSNVAFVETDIQLVTQRIMSAHERVIQRFPEQWYKFQEMWPEVPEPVGAQVEPGVLAVPEA